MLVNKPTPEQKVYEHIVFHTNYRTQLINNQIEMLVLDTESEGTKLNPLEKNTHIKICKEVLRLNDLIEKLHNYRENYLKNGPFDPEKTVDFLKQNNLSYE